MLVSYFAVVWELLIVLFEDNGDVIWWLHHRYIRNTKRLALFVQYMYSDKVECITVMAWSLPILKIVWGESINKQINKLNK